MTLSCTLPLPDNFHARDLIAYHTRDSAQLSEHYHSGILQKGWMWQGQPAMLQCQFRDNTLTVRCDVSCSTFSETMLYQLVQRLTGLNQDIAGFENAMASHPALGPLVQRQAGLRVAVTITPYEALVWAITGQQISVQAAISIRRRLIQAAGCRYSESLWCHPDPYAIARLSSDQLRAAGLSAAKAQTLAQVSQKILQGSLPLDDWPNHISAAKTVSAANVVFDDMRQKLMEIKGIGPWTADYTLLRGYGWLDASLHGDVAVRRSLRTLLQQDTPVKADQARQWLAMFAPWRALAAAHLWAALKLQA